MRALLTGADSATFLEVPAAEFAAPLLAELVGELEPAESGSTLGPYRILREIGHGGMGTVYLAERADHQYEKRVALKILRAWDAANERSVRRFLEERQILASLDHPDIARLLDGGVTAEGVPWFAMERVEGVPIDRHCADMRLSIEERLELFCRVCSAVQYAHRNLVVHRDLKPANILVTAEGAVKLLDFGIAKLLGRDAADASLTGTAELVMTPLYASPEQVRGEPVSTASDVYALGVLLYELLTGRYPYRVATREPHVVARAILEQEPARPSAAVRNEGDVAASASAATTTSPPQAVSPAKLARRLEGDLDTIVATAMRKDPARRYATAEQLEADVRRHLSGLPVAARPDSRVYRTQKFVRRHRVGVGIAAGVALLVATFAGVTTVQSVRISRQAQHIAIERDHAQQVSSFLAGLFQTSDPYAGPGILTAREILDSGAVRVYRDLAGRPEARSRMLLEMGRAYFGLGVRDRARRFVETSMAIRRRSSPEDRTALAETLDFLAVVLLEQGELESAERASREALDLRRQLPGASRDLIGSLNGLAAVLRAAGRFRAAASVSTEAVALDDDDAESLEGLAHAARELGDFAGAERLYARVLQLRRQALPEEQPIVAASIINLAAAIGSGDDPAGADSLFRYGLALKRRLLGDTHPDLAADEVAYARLLHRVGRAGEAEQLYQRALQTARQRLPRAHPLTATILVGLGELRLDHRASEHAEPLLREALAIREAALPRAHPHIGEAEQFLAAAAFARGRYSEANRYALWRLHLLRSEYGDADPRVQAAFERVAALYEVIAQPRQAARYRALLAGGR
ncbi:MAG: serine/threonine-protein kinase [Gemmatimonadetes bacterium]|nr:serine/threonine-protein kinase [Gemmatimonadota bacterium]